MPRSRVVVRLGVALAVVGAALLALAGRSIAERRFRSELDAAAQELLAGRCEAALRRLAPLAGRRPDSGEVHYLMGLGEMALGRIDRAEASWARVPPGDEPHASMAALKWAELDRERGRLSDAEDRLRKALDGSPSPSPRVRWALVQLLALEGRRDEARRLFADGLGRMPDAVEGLKQLYKLEAEPFPAEAARAYFDEAARLAPDDDRVHLGLAHLAIRALDYDRATTLLEAGLARRPDDRATWEMLLECGRQADRPALAARALRHLPAGPDAEERAAELRAWAARLAGDPDAEHRALEQQAPTPAALERLAELAIEAGRPDEAASLRERRAKGEAKRVAYLRRVGTPDAEADPAETARMAADAGRPVDAAFWRWRAAGPERGPWPPPDPPTAPRTLAEAFPDLLAALESAAGSAPGAGEAAPARLAFRDDAEAAGLRFVHESGASGGRLIPPVTFSGGVALLDYDRDGRLDVFLVQSGRFPAGPDSAAEGDRLFRNRGDGTFEDATARAKLDGAHGYGHGVAVGDVDGDGLPDLFVARWRSYALYRNRGDGTFEDATESWGLAGDRDWPTSAAFADLDGDGDLDLYVCHYIAWNENDPRPCVDPADPSRFDCNPRDFPALPDHLFRNDGGRFVDATEEAGIADREGRGLGVVAADFDDDGRVDLFVANDMTADYLFLNRGGLRFEESALESGVAANSGGGYQAGMGVAVGDADGDGRIDLAVTNFYGESTSYFQNLGGGLFADRTAATGLKAASRHLLGFGAAFLDVDDDGRPDLMTANGHIHDGRPVYPWKMPLQLLRNVPPVRFVDVSAGAGPAFEADRIARGLAVGDLDGDGKLDVVVQSQDEPVAFLRNVSEGGRSIAFELEGTASNRDAVGARVTVVAGGRTATSWRTGGGSYQSASSPIVHVGLGGADRAESVEVRWPSGRVDRFEGLPAGATYQVREGDPEAKPRPGPPPG